jgi:hypothetical protein
MSQGPGLGGEIQRPDPASAPWSAPDATGEGHVPTAAGVPPPIARAVPPPYRAQQDRIPLRPLGVGELLDGTFSTIRRNPRTTVGLAALLVTLQQVITLAVQVGTNGLPTQVGVGDERQSVQVLIGGFGGITSALVSAVIGAVITGMLVVVVSEDVLGRRVGAADVWRRIRPRLWPLLLAAAIAGILPYVGLLFLLIPGLILWALWALTAPALVLEGLGPIAALRRSAKLTGPALMRVWGVRTLSVLIGLLIQALIALPFALIGALIVVTGDGDPGTTATVAILALDALGGTLAGMITAPFLAGVLALLYIDRRMRAEGLDFVLRRQERTARQAPVGGGAP